MQQVGYTVYLFTAFVNFVKNVLEIGGKQWVKNWWVTPDSMGWFLAMDDIWNQLSDQIEHTNRWFDDDLMGFGIE